MRRHRASALGAPHSALLVHLALATAAVAAPRTVAPQVGTRQVTTPLRVLRTLPSGDAAPTAAITVIFDRPVAPALERTMNPAQVVRIEPAVAGRYEWRDPITIRFRPTQAMRAGERYTVTVAGAVRGVDGSTLAAPHRFTFRVRGPELLGMSVAGEGNRGRYLGAAPRFVFVYSAPVDLPAFAAAVKLAPSGACAGLAPVTMRALEQRRTTERDSIASYYGSWYGRRGARADPRLDSLRRRIELAPAAALPPGCDVTLTAPRGMIGVAGAGSRENIPLRTFRTRGPFRIAGVECAGGGIPCPVGPLIVRFTMPVRGSEVRRHVRTAPAVPFTIADTMMETEIWPLPGRFAPRTTYRVVADGAMRDVFGQRVNAAASSASVITSGYPPSVSYASGPLLATRGAPRSIAVRHVNVDTLLVTVAPVPRALEAQLATRGYARYPDSIIARLRAAPVRKVPVSARRDEVVVTHVPIVPSAPTSGATGATMLAVIVTRVGDTSRTRALAPIATIQFSDLAIHSRLGAEQGVVWITGVEDGRARDGVHVSLRDATGLAVASATTDAAGLARLDYRGRWDGVDSRRRVAFSTVSAERGDDRAVSSADLWSYGELSPGALGATAEWGSGRFPMAGAVFTERGIYRPGEMVHAKAIVRDGSLGSLAVPERGELVRFRVRTERADSAIADTVTALGAFGTAEFGMTLPASAPLGRYTLLLERKRNDEWLALASARYDVSEYRAPEFSVGWDASAGPRFAGDTLRSALTARYLFGGAMGGAAVSWAARQDPLPAGELRIPGVAGYYVGINDWFGVRERPREERMLGSGAGTLDSAGRIHVTVPLPDSTDGLPSRLVLEATVTDVNRQSVAARTTLRVEPADFYIAARPAVGNAFWTAGAPQRIEMLVVRPNGERVGSVALAAVVTRRDWRYDAAGGPYGGRWVTDTVARCAVVSALEPVSCTVTPDRAGSYVVQLSARDGRGRVARTSFVRWVVGGGATLAWWGQSRFKMNVIANREDEYRVGDTATVVVFSPFADAEAWVTVEREAIIEQRRLRLPAGQTTLRFPITEAYAPNVLVSAFVTRGAAGARDTADRRIAAGYVALRVAPDPKRLAVRVAPLAAEYRPADSARIRVEVRGSRGEGERAEVALWAVDEGVLSLTGYALPDPVALLYQPRGTAFSLASSLLSLLPTSPPGIELRIGSLQRSPGIDLALNAVMTTGTTVMRSAPFPFAPEVLRSEFATTAFFLGAVVTDARGDATPVVKLPDNLTTFRVMAVAVTAGDRYGSGEGSLLVTRPLVARAALPRFVRPGDELEAGAVINRRAGGTPTVTVQASATGIALRDSAVRRTTLEPGRGREVRFPFRGLSGDSAVVRLAVSDGASADAVESRLAIRPDFHPRAHTASGLLRDPATISIALPAGLDLERSRLTLSFGTSPLTVMRGMIGQLRLYPYECTEQVASVASAIIALYRARRSLGDVALEQAGAKRDIEEAVVTVAQRQRPDGGIGYWSGGDWTTPWLSAYAGTVLLDARDAGIAVNDSVVARLAGYLERSLRKRADGPAFVANWYHDPAYELSERLAAAEYLRRAGRPDAAAERDLVVRVGLMFHEDRARLAELRAIAGATREARALLELLWAEVRVEGRRAVALPDTGARGFFPSRQRPLARLLRATIAVDSAHPLVGPLAESVIGHGRAAGRGWWWNTQDYAASVAALAAFERVRRTVGSQPVSVRSASGRVLLETTARPGDGRDSMVSLAGLVLPERGDSASLSLSLATPASGAVYYYLTVTEVPKVRPVRPGDQGIQVERWYERYDTGAPAVSVAEGELVRVRLRITVPAERQFVVLDDALPAGLEVVDPALRTSASILPPTDARDGDGDDDLPAGYGGYGSWRGWWSPWDHHEFRDDRVVYAATVLWRGTYTASYLARATIPGTFIRPPAHAEEMYNPAVNGRSDGGVFTVTAKAP